MYSTIEKRNIGIDIIRGLCILAVILLHLNIQFGFTKTFLKEIIPKGLFRLFFWSGYYGVVIFFTLSGYLITQSILRRWGSLSKIDLKIFYWFRFSRIIPLLVLIVSMLSILHLVNINGFIINPEQVSLLRAIVAVLTFHINWLEIKVGYLPANWDVLWSISIEETFYLFFPLICLFLKKDWHFFFVLILCLAISPWARVYLFEGNELGDKNHLAYLDSISLGCMSAITIQHLSLKTGIKQVFGLLGIILMVLILYFRSFIYKSGISVLGIDVTILSVGTAFILLYLHNTNTQLKKIRILGWLESMGKYSYEIYLTHMFVIIFGVQVFKYFRLNESHLIPFSLLLIFISYFLGKVVFNYFSQPINLRLRKRYPMKKENIL